MKTHGTARALAAIVAIVPLAAEGALDQIPSETGFSGAVLLGAGWVEAENNLVAGNTFADIGQKRVDTVFDDPESEDDVIPVFSGDLRYTVGKWRTQFFFGSDITDLVRFDFANLLGVRKQFDSLGILSIAAAVSNFPAEVWEDPYLAGVDRKKTDRDSQGLRFDWSRIFNSNFSVKVNYRDIDVDKERSGTDPALGLTDEGIRDLRRDGEKTTVNVEYLWKIGERQALIPEIFWIDDDRDGSAVTSEAFGGQLSWTYLGDPWTVVLTGAVFETSYDKRNPIYGKKADEDAYSLGATVFYKLPTDSGRWSIFGSAAYADSDSDIDFHDSTITLISGGVRFRFGQ
jgi:hypothetical protein